MHWPSHIDSSLLGGLKASPFYSIMADESTDISSKEELSVCGRWIENGKAVEHFLGIVRAKEVTAKALTHDLLVFFRNMVFQFRNCEDWGLMCKCYVWVKRWCTDINELPFS